MIRRAYWIGALLIVLGLIIADTRAQIATPEAATPAKPFAYGYGECLTPQSLGMDPSREYVWMPKEHYTALKRYIYNLGQLSYKAEGIILKQQQEINDLKSRLKKVT